MAKTSKAMNSGAKPGFSDAVLKEVSALMGRYPKKVHALLPLLHIVQRENAGWLPPGWDAYVAELCEATLNHVRGVITFYNMFKTAPVGKYHLMVCTCLPCARAPLHPDPVLERSTAVLRERVFNLLSDPGCCCRPTAAAVWRPRAGPGRVR